MLWEPENTMETHIKGSRPTKEADASAEKPRVMVFECGSISVAPWKWSCETRHGNVAGRGAWAPGQRVVGFTYMSPHNFISAICTWRTQLAPLSSSTLHGGQKQHNPNHTPDTVTPPGGQTLGSKACITPPGKPSRPAEVQVDSRETLDGP